MLLVYAMTRAVQHGWGTTETIALLAASAALIVAFVAIELRSSAPLLPMRMFRSRTLSGSNLAGLLMGAAVFSQFFLLTLYMQQVLHYSALQTGVAYVALTLTVIVFANVSQALALRIGVRRVLAVGLLLVSGGLRPLRAAAGGRPLLLGSLPGVPDQRARDGVRLHPDDDRRARRRSSLRRRHRLGADQHDASRSAGRSASPRPRRSPRPYTSRYLPRIRARRRERRSADARLPGRVLRARGGRRRRRGRLGAARRVAPRAAADPEPGSAMRLPSRRLPESVDRTCNRTGRSAFGTLTGLESPD